MAYVLFELTAVLRQHRTFLKRSITSGVEVNFLDTPPSAAHNFEYRGIVGAPLTGGRRPPPVSTRCAMTDNKANFFGTSGYLTPEEIELLRNVYQAIADQPWFTSDRDARDRFAAQMLEMYRRGLVIPEKLRVFCMAAARAKYSEIDCADHPLKGRRVLIVEDCWDQAHDMVRALSDCGASVVGPASNLDDAMRLLDGNIRLHGALLDVRLGKEKVFPVAERLHNAGVPFAFVTGYNDEIPAGLGSAPRAIKPVTSEQITGLAATMVL